MAEQEATYQEPTDDEIKAAEAELLGQTELLESSPVDRLLPVLVEWDSYETVRLASAERYLLIAELPGMDRNTIVKEFARAKKAVLTLEARLLEILQMMSTDEREALLKGQSHVYQVPGVIRTLSIKPTLADRLRKRLPTGASVNGSNPNEV